MARKQLTQQVLMLGLISWLTLLIAAVGWRAGIRISEIGHFSLLLLREMGLLGLLLGGAFGYGALFLKITGLRKTRDGMYFICAVSLGLGVLAHLSLALGALHLLYEVAAWVLLVSGMIMGLVDLYKHHSKPYLGITLPGIPSVFTTVLLVILVTNCLYPLLTDALSPPLWWDEAAYHLAVPKLYVQHHAIIYIPFIPYSNWPMEAEMLFTLGLLLRSEVLAHLVEWSAFLLVCWSLYLAGRHFFSPQVDLLAATLFSLTPMALTLSGTGLIEPTLTLYVFLATIFYLEWTETRQRVDWILAAIFGGLAASTKLNGALIPLVVGILTAILTLRQTKSFKNAWTCLLQFGLISFAVVAPWYIKTWIHTGNPFWPFLLQMLGGRDWDLLGNEYLLGFIRKPNLPLTLSNWLAGLWYLTFDYQKFGPSQFRLGAHYLPLLPLVIPAVLLVEKGATRRTLHQMSLVALLYYTLWFLQTHQSRFLMPTIPVLAILAAYGVVWLMDIGDKKFSGIIQCGLMLLILCTHWSFSPAARELIVDRWQYLSGRIGREDFLVSRVPGYAVFSYANENLPRDAYVLLALYECRGYYLDRRYMWANPISQRVLRLEQFATSEELSNELRSRGVTHILFRPVGLERFAYIRHAGKITQLTYALLKEETNLVLSTPDLELYELAYRAPSEQ
ncbi:MAG: ArnT family glycosyltransferase [Anaerolineae bacterium]